MKRGRILSHHRDVQFFVGPGQSHLAGKGKREFPLRTDPPPPSFPRCGDAEAARGTATVWERGQTRFYFAQLIP
jgi:hypothetical protein